MASPPPAEHNPALDGLRSLAIAAVLLADGGVSWARGGLLGANLFLVLSGFLITRLFVLGRLDGTAGSLGAFWAARARRLVPALIVVVVVVGLYAAARGRDGAVPGIFSDGLSGLLGYANWHQIASSVARGAPISPLSHLWPLSIVEQFYLLWPLLLLGGATLVRRHGPADPARRLDLALASTLALLLGSVLDTTVLAHHGASLARLGEGTDTRATDLLCGAALAIAWVRFDQRPRPAHRGRPDRGAVWRAVPGGGAVGAVSLVALAGIVAMIVAVPAQARWLHPLGFLLVDLLTLILIVTVVAAPAGALGRLLSLAPLRGLGRISYGLYLWHLPLFLWITPTGALDGWKLFLLRAAVAVIVATASLLLLEQPVRQRRWPDFLLTGLAPLGAGAGAVSLALAASAGATPPPVASHVVGLRGDATCTVRLANTPLTGEVAPTAAQLLPFELKTIDKGTVHWPVPASVNRIFHTCDPTPRALVVGDSIAFSIALPELATESEDGMAISDAAVLGCAFETHGEIDLRGKLTQLPSGCPGAMTRWAAQANAFGADVVIVELGYRDEFNWREDGRTVHLGQPADDAVIERAIARSIVVLGDHGRRKVLFLSIPHVAPEITADSQRDPQTTDARRDAINALIARAVRQAGPSRAGLYDIDQMLSPDGQYTSIVNGRVCRTDGIHLTPYCAELLQAPIFRAARTLIGRS